jgi:hypothetical protein
MIQRRRLSATLQNYPPPPDDSAPEVKHLRDFYRLWKSHNGVLADRLMEYHRAFFSWLTGNQ